MVKKPGRPRWSPTPEQRALVRSLAQYGTPVADICNLVGVAEKTLRKHCFQEIEESSTMVNAKVAEFLFRYIQGGPGDYNRLLAAQFWLSRRAGWREGGGAAGEAGAGGPTSRKEIVKAEADAAAVGRFAVPNPPKLVVDNG